MKELEINGLKSMTHLMILETIYQFSFPRLPINPKNIELQGHSSPVLPTDPEHVGAADVLELRKNN